MMICRVLAEIALAAHLLFIVFAALGATLVLRWRALAWLHLPCAVWAGAIALGGWICPLTYLEVRLRHCAGQAGYAEGFMAHYLLPLVYPEGLTRELQVALGVGVLSLNALIYALVLRQAGRRQPPGI
jgi:hypothetical protein